MALFRNFCRILAAGTKARNHCSILRELYSDNCHIVRYMRPQESAVQGLGMTSLRESEGAKMKQDVFLPDDYTPAESEPFMNERQVEYFRRKLQKWKSELLAGSRDTIEALQDGTRNIPDVNDYLSGKKYTLFQVKGTRFGAPICWENIFPDIARKFVADGAEFLINITNEAWFGETAAPYQFLSMNVFRAVDNRVYVIRCANSGVSCIIDPTGKIVGRATDTAGNDIFVSYKKEYHENNNKQKCRNKLSRNQRLT